MLSKHTTTGVLLAPIARCDTANLEKAQLSAMSSRVDEFALPLTKVIVYMPTDTQTKLALDTFTQCLPGVPTDEVDMIHSFLASYFEYYLNAQLDQAFNECGYQLKREPMTDAVIATWRSLYKPVVLPDPLYIVVNNCLIVMLCAKPVIEVGYRSWAKSRAKAIFQLYKKQLPEDGSKYLLSFEWASIIAGWMQDSQSMRINFLTHAIILGRGATQYRRAYMYAATMLRYARLTTIVLVRLFLISARSGILREPYLASDVYCWKIAANTLNSYPRDVRPYAGILADLETAALLGGRQLHKLTYIAVKVGEKKQKSLSQFKIPSLPDELELDRLIQKHFPEVQMDVPLLPYEELGAVDVLEAKPVQEMFAGNLALVQRAFKSLEPVFTTEDKKTVMIESGHDQKGISGVKQEQGGTHVVRRSADIYQADVAHTIGVESKSEVSSSEAEDDPGRVASSAKARKKKKPAKGHLTMTG